MRDVQLENEEKPSSAREGVKIIGWIALFIVVLALVVGLPLTKLSF